LFFVKDYKLNYIMKLGLVICFLVISAFGFSMGKTQPEDSTSNILDKSVALVMLEEGKRLFIEGKTKDALIQFRQVQLKDPNSWRPYFWIANCHFALSNFGFALKYGNQAVEKNVKNVDPEVYELLGKTYHHLNMVDSAIVNYEKALKFMSQIRIKDLKIQTRLDECIFAKAQYEKGDTLKRVKLGKEVNTGYDEYGALLTSDGKTMYFTARRNDTKGAKANPDDQDYFEDIYRAVWNEEALIWDSVTNDIDRINSNGFDSFSHIDTTDLKAYITVNTTSFKARKKTKGSDIFEIEFSNKGKWSTPKPIKNKYINSSFFDGAPSVTADGNTMYFVSDRKGKKRSTDIYVVNKINDKEWGEPVVLSDSINTEDSETTPFITPDGRYLFFSSKGHLGMGGYDVFVAENLGNGNWTKAVNLGSAFNTVNNDTHFKYFINSKQAFLSGTEIVGNKSSVDIFQIDMSNFTYPSFD